MEGNNDLKTTFLHIESLIEENGQDIFTTPKVITYDITNEAKNERFKYINRTNIKGLINKKIIVALRSNGFLIQDLLETILIIDIDGVYIDNDLIIENQNIKQISYSVNGIECEYKNGIIERNNRKKDNILFLLEYTKFAFKKPLTVYYYSCNLEHVLYNKFNCSQSEKDCLAKQSVEMTDEAFWSIVCSNSLSDDYYDSWSKLIEIKYEIPRATNLNVLFNKYKNTPISYSEDIDVKDT